MLWNKNLYLDSSRIPWKFSDRPFETADGDHHESASSLSLHPENKSRNRDDSSMKWSTIYCSWLYFFAIQYSFEIHLPNYCAFLESSLQLETDLVNIIYLSILLLLVMMLSFRLRKRSEETISEYIWILSLPTMTIWLAWLSLAFIFEHFYLRIKSTVNYMSQNILEICTKAK